MQVYALIRQEMGESDVLIAIFDENGCISDSDLNRLNQSKDYSYILEEITVNEFDIDDEL